MPGFSNAIAHAARISKWILVTALALAVFNYLADVRLRSSVNSGADRWQTSVSDTQQGAYTAKYIFVTREKILLRLYRTGDPALLAERIYEENGVDLKWTENKLIYDTASGDGHIALPPSQFDRLLARLP